MSIRKNSFIIHPPGTDCEVYRHCLYRIVPLFSFNGFPGVVGKIWPPAHLTGI